MADEKRKVQSYTLNLGFRVVGIDHRRDIVPYHEMGLISTPDEAGNQTHITIQFWSDLQQFAPTELGFHRVSESRIEIKAPISEFDRAHTLLRSEAPVFFEFNQFDVVGGDPDTKSITAASMTAGGEVAGQGARNRRG